MAKVKNTQDTDSNQVAAFLSHARSLADIVAQFDLTANTAKAAIDSLREEGYDIFSGPPNFHGEATWVAVPEDQVDAWHIKFVKRMWTWEVEPSGQPYGVVKFLSTFAASKIKIVPIDGILYGDAAHDSRRFDEILEQIRKDDNTFAFLNGDIIAEIKGGSLAERETLLLERTAQFIRKMAPIAHKFLWAQQGCLEARSHKSQGFDPLEYCCDRLSIPYFKEPVYIDIVWGGNVFTLWAMHGNSTAQLKGARMNALRRPAVMHDWTHFIIGGHVGDAMWNRIVKICRDPVAGKLVPREEFHVILGNFKKYLGTKSARRGHTPPSSETLVLHLYKDGSHHVKTAHQSEASHA